MPVPDARKIAEGGEAVDVNEICGEGRCGHAALPFVRRDCQEVRVSAQRGGQEASHPENRVPEGETADPHVVAPCPVRVQLRRQDGEADVGHLAKQGEERGLDTANPWRESVREL